MKNSVENIYNSLIENGIQKKVPIGTCPLRIYCAISEKGNYMVSIMSKTPTNNITSTKGLNIEQFIDLENNYCINIELLDRKVIPVFMTLCNDLIEAVTDIQNEEKALIQINNRFYYWQELFKKNKSISEESLKGLYGELYFLNSYMIPKYGIERAIQSWGGPELLNKDYSIDDKWYEIKTISVNANSVKISSLAQLSSDKEGKLVVVRVEKMSEEYNDTNSSIEQLFSDVMSKTESVQLKEMFLQKVIESGFELETNERKSKFKVVDISQYIVNEDFPRINEDDIKFKDIKKVSYEIPLVSMEKFKVEN